MSCWTAIPLGEFAESVDYGVTASATQKPSGPKFLRITDIQDGSVNWDTVPWCECNGRAALDSRLAPGDIVFVRTGATTGKSFLIRDCPTGAVFASYLIRVRVGVTADPRYVSHFFQTPAYWAQITMSARGVAQPGVNATTLKALEVPLPPLPEQQRIADILDRADTLRAKRRAALAQLDTLTQSIFLDMFGDPFAQNVKTVKLGDVADILMGQSPPGSSYNTIEEGIPLLNGPTEFGERYPIETQWTTEPSRLCEAGDILFCVRGATAGRLNCADKTYCLGRGLAAIRPRIEMGVNADYIFTVLERYYGYFQAKGVGSTFINIKRDELESLPIPHIQQESADTLARRASAVEALKTTHKVALAKLDALFASLQHRGFGGEL